MSMVSGSRYLEISWARSGESVNRTGVRKLRCDRGSRNMIRIEWTCGLAFDVLGFNFIYRLDATYVGHPRECHNFRGQHDGQKEARHLDHLGVVCCICHDVEADEGW